MNDLSVRSTVVIPASAMSFAFARSGGKGGQNVNKVSTKVELSVDVSQIRCPVAVRARMMAFLARMLDQDGKIRIIAQESRSQWQNRRQAVEKLEALIFRATMPVTHRVATTPTAGSRRRRIDRKKKAGEKKQHRTQRFSAGDD